MKTKEMSAAMGAVIIERSGAEGSPSPQPSPPGEGAPAAVKPGEFRMVKRELIAPSKTNPRKHFDAVKLEELAGSIRVQGILQPLLIRPLEQQRREGAKAANPDWQRLVAEAGGHEWEKSCLVGQAGGYDTYRCKACDATSKRFGVSWPPKADVKKLAKCPKAAKAEEGCEFELVAGERRWRAAGLAKLEELPCIVREMSDQQVLEGQYIENGQREDLTALEEAEGFRKLIDECGYTVERLMEKLGKSRSHIFSRLRLVKLVEPVRKALQAGGIDASIAGLLAGVANAAGQKELLGHAQNGWSVRHLKDEIARRFQKNLSGAPWKWEDAELVKKAGPCTTCPKRSENIEGFDGSPNVCTDVDCFAGKGKTYGELMLKAAKAEGRETLSAEAWQDARHQYVQLDEKCYEGNEHGNRTWRAVIGKLPEGVKPAVAVTREGVQEVMPRKEAIDIAPRSWKSRSSSGNGSYQKEQAAKRKSRELARKVIAIAAPKLAEAAEKKKPGKEFWRWLGNVVVHDDSTTVLRRREIAESANYWSKPKMKELEKWGEEQLRGFVVEAIALRFGGISQYNAQMTQEFKGACELFGIDLKALEKEALAKPKGKVAQLISAPRKGSSYKPNANGVYLNCNQHAVVFARAKGVKVHVSTAQQENKTWVYGYNFDIEGTTEGCGVSTGPARKGGESWKTEEEALLAGLLQGIGSLVERRKERGASSAVSKRVYNAQDELGELIRARQAANKEKGKA